MFRSSRTQRRRARGLTANIEPLEDRTLLSAAAVDLSSLSVDTTNYSSSEILVKWNTPADANGFDHAAQAAGILAGSTSRAISPLHTDFQIITLPDSVDVQTALKMFSSNPLVEYAQLNYTLSIEATPNDPQFDQMWGLENTGQSGGVVDADIDASTAWNVHTGSGNTVVAVIDTGVDYTHPDLAANIWINADEIPGDGIDNDGNGYVDDYHGYDFFNHDGNPMDDQGHGTHVAGTIGAVGNNGIGVTGINWDVQLMALKFLGSNGSGTTADGIEAILYAVDNGAHVINASWGGDPYSQMLFDAIATAQANNVIFVAAAGNGDIFGIGQDNDEIPFYPANYDLDNIVSVAAVDRFDDLAFFSNYGATTVDLAAPGVDILSTTMGGGYGLNTGTSMAAPHVTGVLALVRDAAPEWTYRQIIDQVLNNVDPLPQLQFLTITGGRLNAANALPLMRPEIQVSFDGFDVTDDVGVVNIGATLPDVALDATFTVSNVGTEDIILDPNITLPTGFVLVSGFSDTILSFGESTQFTVRLETPVTGNYSGEISFNSNDEDESPFNFTIDATVSDTIYLDDGDHAVTLSGSGWGDTQGVGFDGDIHWNAAGTGTDTAEWTVNIVPGAYNFALTWKSGANRATNAPISIFDGATLIGSLLLNQEIDPNDFADAGANWENLGSFNITGNSVIVRLTDAADEFVIADALRVERIEPAPEIVVTQNGVDVADGAGAVSFGTVLTGSSLSKTFTVTNTGLANLELSEPISVPAGFSVTQSFGSTTLAPGESTTFVITLDAAATGTFSGAVSFGNNDADEAPFDFTVSGSVSDSLIVDDGDAGFVTTGANWGITSGVGFNGDVLWNAAGTGAETAQWTVNVAPGTYQIAATWQPGSNRATNAPFTIFDGANAIGTAIVNQELAPGSFTADGASWESLGEFNITSGTITIRLTDAANEFVIADAVRIAPVAPAPEIQISSGGTELIDAISVIDFGTALAGTPIARTFTVTNVGTDTLTLTEPITVPTGFVVAQSFGTTTLAPGASTTFVIELEATTAGSYVGQIAVGSNDSDESPFDIIVSGTVGDAMIVDDGDAGFSTTGANWGTSTGVGHDGDQRWNAAGNGSETATWTANLAPGFYEVAITWQPGTNRATNSPFVVLDGSNVVGTVLVNQESAPNDFTADGSSWKVLGSFEVTTGALTVRLSDAANEYVIADAVRIAKIAQMPEIAVTVDGVDVVDDTGVINFGSALVGIAATRTFTVTNNGLAELTLDTPITLPAGFTLLQSFGVTTLAPGESTTFVVQFDAATAGSFSGEVSFGNNDADESPFNFVVTASAGDAVIIDDGDAGFNLTGANWGTSSGVGYAGDIRWNAAGGGAETATWTTNLAPGTYQVAVTWKSGTNRATNAPFTVLDGTNPLATVAVNQQVAPNGFTADGATWLSLGEFTVTSGSVTVRLSDAANGFVIADAVRISAGSQSQAQSVAEQAPSHGRSVAGPGLFTLGRSQNNKEKSLIDSVS